MFGRLLLAALAVALPFAVACDGDDGDGGTATPAASVTAAATAGPTIPPDAIRAVNLEESQPVVDLLAETGGAFVQADVLYTDLTEDGVEEAIVPVASGGTLGFVAFTVLTPADGDVEAILTDAGAMGINVALQGSQLVSVEPVPGPDDPECCPSQLKTTVYAWDGDSLEVDSEITAPNPDGGAKTPAVSP